MLMVVLYVLHGCRTSLQECVAARDACESALEKVPPDQWRRVADELAECRQHLEEADASSRRQGAGLTVETTASDL